MESQYKSQVGVSKASDAVSNGANKNHRKKETIEYSAHFLLPFLVVAAGGGGVGVGISNPLARMQASQYHFSGVGDLSPTQARWNYGK